MSAKADGRRLRLWAAILIVGRTPQPRPPFRTPISPMNRSLWITPAALAVALIAGGCSGATSAVTTARTDGAAFPLLASQNALLTVKSQGPLVTGTLLVPTSATPTTKTVGALSAALPPGNYGFNGILSSDSTFRATGNVPNVGPFTMNGTLGSGTTSGGFTFTIGTGKVSGALSRE